MEMLTYSLSECGGKPIYRYIYECIKNDILNGTIPSGEKLPSKRSLASNLKVAVITIENAYSMLEAEGYIYTVEKKGYYVSDDMRAMLSGGVQAIADDSSNRAAGQKKTYKYDLTMSSAGRGQFSFRYMGKAFKEDPSR